MPYLLIDSHNVIQNVVDWDGVAPWTPPGGMTLVNYTGSASCGVGYAWNGTDPVPPASATPTVIPSLQFIRRMTAAEQTALMAANPAWGAMVAAANVINVTDPVVVGYLQTAVSDGAITQARATQVLNLAVASP